MLVKCVLIGRRGNVYFKSIQNIWTLSMRSDVWTGLRNWMCQIGVSGMSNCLKKGSYPENPGVPKGRTVQHSYFKYPPDLDRFGK